MPATPAEATITEITNLITFDTTSRDSNLPLIDHVEARLQAAGIESRRIPNPEGTKANLSRPFLQPTARRRAASSCRSHRRRPRRRSGLVLGPVQARDRDGKYFAAAIGVRSFVGVILSHLEALSRQN